jgi:FeS assembly SUF system regulator
MLRLSRLTDYAIVVLAALARDERRATSARVLMEETGVPWPTVVKVLKALGDGGLLHSSRGRHGGYRLVRPPEAIGLTDVIEAVEGDIGLTECSRQEGECNLHPVCRVADHWGPVNQAVRASLAGITLAELAAPVHAGAARNAKVRRDARPRKQQRKEAS